MSLSRLLLLVLLLSGCADYRVTVNERTVYNPDPLFTEYLIPDPGLHACVAATIEQQKISSVSQLLELDCRDRGINRLEGLEAFVSLRYLNLQGNAELHCPESKGPLDRPGLSITLPQHCPEL